jgi:hypothetical protein
MQRLILILIVSGCVLGFGAPARADIFRLVNQSGNSLQSVAFEVRDASGGRIAWGTTDTLGRFVVNHERGSYRLIVRLGGRDVTTSINIEGRGDLKRVVVQAN